MDVDPGRSRGLWPAPPEVTGRSTVLDFAYFAGKDTSVLHASLQAAAAVGAGRAGEAAEYRRQGGAVEEAVRAGAVRAIVA
jgi:hypothetical protein